MPQGENMSPKKCQITPLKPATSPLLFKEVMTMDVRDLVPWRSDRERNPSTQSESLDTEVQRRGREIFLMATEPTPLAQKSASASRRRCGGRNGRNK